MSGGVDSSVAFALLARSLGHENCYGLMVDQGLLRHQEGKLVSEAMAVCFFYFYFLFPLSFSFSFSFSLFLSLFFLSCLLSFSNLFSSPFPYPPLLFLPHTPQEIGFTNFHLEDASDMFLGRLKGEIDPEVKRKIIGQAFLDAKAEVAKRLHLDDEVGGGVF